jgi:cytochrome c peroxidase
LYPAHVRARGPERSRSARRRLAAVIGFVGVIGLGSAAIAQSDVVHRASLSKLITLYKRPIAPPSPPDNPTTAAKVELGKMLFFDPRLSGQGTISCGTCHNPSLGWQDGLVKGVGTKGGQLGRRTPTILDTAWSRPLFWDGRAATLEAQAKGPLAAEAEMNMPHAMVVQTLTAIPGYVAAFNASYPGETITIDTVAKAIAVFERTVVSKQAPFDRWVAGDNKAISEEAKRGFVVFNGKAGCASCHSGWRLTDDGFHDVGLPDADLGRGKLMPSVNILQHAFKTPTLRNTADRAPYMHDGSLPTLEAVIDHYDHGFVTRSSLSSQMKPLSLNFGDKADLEAFLFTLSSKDDKVTLPTLPR